MSIKQRLARLEKRLQGVRPRCPACADRPLLSSDPRDGDPCPSCRSVPNHTLVQRVVVSSREQLQQLLDDGPPPGWQRLGGPGPARSAQRTLVRMRDDGR